MRYAIIARTQERGRTLVHRQSFSTLEDALAAAEQRPRHEQVFVVTPSELIERTYDRRITYDRFIHRSGV